MKLKSIMKKTAACLAAMGCLLLDVTAFGAERLFSPLYSGKFNMTEKVYFTISKEDAALTKVIYPISALADRFVTTNSPDEMLFNSKVLIIDYGHKGMMTTLEGEYVGMTPENVYISADSISFKRNFLGIITSATVVLYGRDYTCDHLI